MNFTCINSVDKCNGKGVTEVFDRSFNNGAYSITFFRCNDHLCGSTGVVYNVMIGTTLNEWTCYNNSVPKDCSPNRIPI